MAINIKNFNTVVSDTVAAIQGAASQLVDLSIGSILRAVVEANASLVVWLESLLLQVLALTRASTSNDVDLDTWLADFGFARLPGAAATGQVTFTRFTATAQATVAPGVSVQSADGSLQYTVIADPANPNYNSGLGLYVLPAGTASASITVRAAAVGKAYNAQTGQINTLSSAVPGIDTVANAATFVTGADPESDTAVRARFVSWIASLSKATRAAVAYAITSVVPSASFSIVENVTYAGTPAPDYFYVVVDDGTGAPTAGTMTALFNAIDAVRPLTSTFNVYAPIVVTATVSLTLTIATGYDVAATKAAVSAAITSFINGQGLGAGLAYSRLAQLAYDASPGVLNVTAMQLNGGTADLAGTIKQSIRAGVITIS